MRTKIQTGKKPRRCSGGCRSVVIGDVGALSYCEACWFVRETCAREGVLALADLADRRRAREETFGRVCDLIRRSEVEDAERLCLALERLVS
jgi:hypothetical protein